MTHADKESWLSRFRDANRRRIIKLVDNRIYRFTLLLSCLLFLARVLDPTAGSVQPSLLAQMPNWIFQLLGVLWLPVILCSLELQRQVNLSRYDPEAPEIQAKISKWRKAGWAAASVAMISLSVLIFIMPQIQGVLPWSLIFVLCVALMVTLGAFSHANSLADGSWTPPEWLSPMDGLETKKADEELRTDE